MRAVNFLSIAAVALSSGAAAQQQTEPRVNGNLGQFFGRDQYPPAALRAREQGRVVAVLTISVGGRVTGCVINVSSGSSALDATTCRIAHERIGFVPAKDARGRPVEGRYPLSVLWTLNGEAGPSDGTIDVAGVPDGSVDLTVSVRIGSDGRITSCQATNTAGGGSAPDPCVDYPVGRKVMPTMVRNGQPVGATITQRFTTTTRYDP